MNYDTLPAIISSRWIGSSDVMHEKPRSINESFFSRGAGIRALIGGTSMGLLTLLAFYIGISLENIPSSEIKNLKKVLTLL